MEDVLDDLKRLSRKALFAVVATRPAMKFLPDGRNTHILLRSRQWWLEQFLARFELQQFQGLTGEFAALFTVNE